MDGLNNVFADVDSIHKTDLLEVRLRVRAAANIPLTDKVAKRPHFWEVLSSLLINLFVKKDPRFRVSLNVKLTTLGSDPLTKFLRHRNKKPPGNIRTAFIYELVATRFKRFD